MRSGVFGSLYQILDKRVLPSLFPLFDNPKLDRELRCMIKETFAEFCEPPIEGEWKPKFLLKSRRVNHLHIELTFQVVKSTNLQKERALIDLTRYLLL